MAVPPDVMSVHGQPDICPRCGALLSVGDFPFCGGKNNHGRYYGTNAVDTLHGGPRWVENLGPEPIYIETKSQLARECKTRGLVNVVRHVDSDHKNPDVPRWA